MDSKSKVALVLILVGIACVLASLVAVTNGTVGLVTSAAAVSCVSAGVRGGSGGVLA
jgi:hypothetical protein